MSMSTFIRFLQFALPRPIFKKIRRTIPLCDYNIHSATKKLRNYRRYKRLPPTETCKHCGQHVYRDGKGEWKAHLVIPQSAYEEPAWAVWEELEREGELFHQ